MGRGAVDVLPEKNGKADPWASVGGDTPLLGAERMRRKQAAGIKAPPPTRGPESPAPRNLPLGGVQALTFLQGRQGMVKHTSGIVRLLADRLGTDGGYNFP